jgi:hypothetical protein
MAKVKAEAVDEAISNLIQGEEAMAIPMGP